MASVDPEIGKVRPDAPPTYESVTDPTAPPPSYKELFGEFRQSRHPSEMFGVALKCCGICCTSIFALVAIGVLSIIPIIMVTLGSIYLHDCPAERFIPIYLIVGGVFYIFKSAVSVIYRVKDFLNRQVHNRPEEAAKPNPFDGVLNLFLLAWFIAGSVWVYRAMWPNFHDRNDPKHPYCQPVLYYFTFVIITIQYVFLLLGLALCCCCCSCAICFHLLGITTPAASSSAQ